MTEDEEMEIGIEDKVCQEVLMDNNNNHNNFQCVLMGITTIVEDMDILIDIVFISNNNRQCKVLTILTNKVTVMVISMVISIITCMVIILIIEDNCIVAVITQETTLVTT